jgi:hypothetical protein
MSGATELLARIDLPAVLATAEPTCFSYCTRLATAARAQAEAGPVAALLLLLSDVTAFELRPDDEPALGHRTAFFDRRVQAVDDLDAEQLEALSSIVEQLQDAELRARVADVLFIRRRHNRFVAIAVDAYVAAAERLYSRDNWVEAAERYVRAFAISCRSQSIREQLLAKLVSLIETRKPDSGYCTAILMEPMLERRVGDAAGMAAIAGDAAAEADKVRDWNRARRYLRLEASWHGVAGDEAGKTRARAEAAERLVRVADDIEQQSAAVAAMHLSTAIHTFRQIPGQQTRIDALLRKLDDVQRAAVTRVARFSHNVDVTEEANRIRAHFAGLEKHDVLVRLVTLFDVPDAAQLQRSVEENSRNFISQRLVPLTFVNARGRVISRRNAVGAGSPAEQQRTLIQAAYEQAGRVRDYRVNTYVLPAWHQIIDEHDFGEADLQWLVEASPFCPSGHESLFARGLVAGFRGEFVVALYMLFPQVEHGIRGFLEDAGAITWKMDENGIQQDKDLGSLLFMHEARQVFGDDLLFELRGFLVEKNGTNLRNLAAHGLLDSNQSNSRPSVYLWWLALYLLIRPLLRQSAIAPPNTASANVETDTGPAQEAKPSP